MNVITNEGAHRDVFLYPRGPAEDRGGTWGREGKRGSRKKFFLKNLRTPWYKP